MLEDALKSGSLSKDVGWRRSSRDTGPLQPVSSPPVTASLPTSQSQQTSISESEAEGGAPAPDSSGSDRDSRPPSPAPPPLTDLRFFRFRFTGSGRSTPTQPRSSSSRVSRSQGTSHPAAGHLTSASLPSLVTPPTVVNSELEELREQLLIEKGKSEKVMREKSELESELESLSQALFEEANRMVKVERIKRAEAEDELQEVHAEKDALKSALRLIEEHRLRAESSHQQHVNGIEPSEQTIAPTLPLVLTRSHCVPTPTPTRFANSPFPTFTNGGADRRGDIDKRAGLGRPTSIARTSLARTALRPTTTPHRLCARLAYGLAQATAASTPPVAPPYHSPATCAAATICRRRVPYLAVGMPAVWRGGGYGCGRRDWLYGAEDCHVVLAAGRGRDGCSLGQVVIAAYYGDD